MERIQQSIATSLFRESDTLSLARQYLPASENLRILSFGCSIGDELASLRSYFPRAEIFGCEIDPTALRLAHYRVGHLANVFLSDYTSIQSHGPYNLICAFSSLCLHPLPKPFETLKTMFPFTKFEDIVSFLATQLTDNGIFAVKNSTYPFMSVPSVRHFSRLRSDHMHQNGFIPTVNPNGNIALGLRVTPPIIAFEVKDVDGLDDWDFIDSIYVKTSSPNENSVIFAPCWEKPDSNLTEVANWSRSNLDALNEGPHKLIEIIQNFTTFTSDTRPGEIYIVKDTLKRSIRLNHYIHLGKKGWWENGLLSYSAII